MANTDRPLSPHLQVYRWQLTMLLSITHRATGIALSGGVLLLVYWIWALTAGQDDYRVAVEFFGSVIGRTVLFVMTLCLFYHLCNGIRHLFWDIGRGLELKSVYASGWAVTVATVLLTLGTWIAAYMMHGGQS